MGLNFKAALKVTVRQRAKESRGEREVDERSSEYEGVKGGALVGLSQSY